ncbi:lymphocyte cytosolic protein 2 [Cyprinodon tularosa]|uniref:lymphocyte cytosolic protein 2 n=1 Tax=Cyprinodon tularosa TaxID=77115 RepID=UPI0018E26E37|nr:lymphocyte cytosolic protein 2 [Cyprinodon tularosa]
MSLTEGLSKEEVMTWRPEKLADYMRQDSDSDEYEEFQQEAADGNYIVPLNEPHAAESPQNTKAEDHRFPRPPGPQKVFKGPCHPMAEGSVVMATGSHTNSRQVPAIPQRTVFTRENNQTPNVPAPAPRTHLSAPTKSSRQVLDPSWYRGRITRHQAEVSLREVNKDGAFLVRDSSHSSSQHPYTLMLLYQARIFNIKIQKQNECYYLGNGTKNTKSFLGVREMIIHHMNTPLLLIDAADQGSEEQLQCCLLHPAGL